MIEMHSPFSYPEGRFFATQFAFLSKSIQMGTNLRSDTIDQFQLLYQMVRVFRMLACFDVENEFANTVTRDH